MLTSHGATYTTTTEIWQLGCLAYELAVGKPLLEAPEYLRKLMAHHELPPALKHCEKSKDFLNFITSCLDKDPAKRLTIA